MKLFKSKADRDMEKRMLVRKTTQQINKYIGQLQMQKTKAIDAAKKSKIEGSQAAYNLAVSSLKMAMSQEKKAKEMLLNFELALQMRDLTSMTAGFLDGMSVISKEMKTITGDMNFAKVQKQFEEAMIGVEQTTDNIDIMLDSSEMSFAGIASSNFSIADAEIDALINSGASADMSKMDAEIESLEKSLAAQLKN